MPSSPPRSITANEYDKKYAEFREQQGRLSEKIQALGQADHDYYITVEHLLKLASKAPELFKKADFEQRRLLLSFSLQNLKLDGKKLVYQYKKPFDVMVDCKKNNLWLPTPVQNFRKVQGGK